MASEEDGCGAPAPPPPPPPHRRPTWKQALILATILAAKGARGFGPTYRELTRAMGATSPNAATEQVKKLEELGYLLMEAHRARSLVVLVQPDCPCCNGSGQGKAHKHLTITRSSLRQELRPTLCPACRGTGYRLREDREHDEDCLGWLESQAQALR